MKIDTEMILLSHKLIIEATGGSQGIKDINLLVSVIDGIYNTFDGVELYPTKEDKAAYLAYGIAKNHAFVDGNKRVGINTMISFLKINGINLKATDEELVALGLSIAESTSTIEKERERIKNWIIDHEI